MKRRCGGEAARSLVLVGSLTAANAVERIRASRGDQGHGDQGGPEGQRRRSASTAQTNAQTILATNPDINGLYGVYSYDGPALAQAVRRREIRARVKIVCDDRDPQTLKFISSGTIAGTVVQMPYAAGLHRARTC